MAFLIVQGGNTLYKVDPDTGAATALSLPSGVTLSTTRKPRFAVLNQWVVIVNSPTRNLAIDPEGTVRVLVPRPPLSPPYMVGGSGTGLTGTWKVKQSFVVEDTAGNLLMESPLSPASAGVAVTNKDLAITLAAISEDSITKRRLYRNTTGGTSFFNWIDIDGNVATSAQSGLADAALSLLPAATSLQAPPGTLAGTRLKNIVSWKNRLWATSDNPDDTDTIRYSEDGKVYAWPNSLDAYPKGQDSEGVIGFAPRKNELGILKRNGLWQITGTANSNFSIVQLTFDKAGCVAPDSIVVVNDRAFWLGKDGVYEWSSEGIRNITDTQVKPWFEPVAAKNAYFATGQFTNAFARYNEAQNSYELHLAALGSTTADRWVSFNLTNRCWYGPHKTAAFTPSHAGRGLDGNALPITLVGGTDGVLYKGNSATFHDGSSSIIDFDCYGPWHHGDAPNIEHCWLQLSMLSRIESSGTMDVIPYVGRLAAAAGSTITHTLTTGRELLRRLGDGALMRLRIRQNTLDIGGTVYGYEVEHFEIGKR